jgi:hypothetical protein
MSINHRIDTRTLKEFKQDILLHTRKETFLINLWKREKECRGHKIEIEDYGCDNSGKFLKQSDNRPDFKVKINGREKLIEIKGSSKNLWTFKTSDLRKYIEYKCWILVIWNTGDLKNDPTKINLKTTRYGIITTNKIKYMLRTYKEYSEPSFGYKKCIRIKPEDFSKIVRIERISCLQK